MAASGETQGDAPSADERRERGGSGSFHFLDQALWQHFREAQSPEAFTHAWLALLCRFVRGASRAVVVLGEPEQGPFAPAAHWPDDAGPGADLSAAAEAAMEERRGVVRGRGEGASQVACPLLVDEHLFGVVAVEVAGAEPRAVLRQLQWGAAWMELLYRREQSRSDEESRERTAAAFDLVAVALAQRRFEAACNATVTELAMRLGCDQVSVGFVRRRRTVVGAVSHAAQFGGRMNLIRDLGAAMDEAVDQAAVIVYPPKPEWDFRITRAHAELAQAHHSGAVLTVPLHADGDVLGALTFERPPGETFDEATVELCDCVAGVVGPILDEKRRNDRLILVKMAESLGTQLARLVGPRYLGRKLATLVFVALVAFFSTATGQYRATSPAIVEGEIQRTLVAPFDGYLASQRARAGEIVREGDVLATLDDEDLVLKRLRWETKRRQHATEYDRALAEEERAEARIVRARMDQAAAQVALLEAQLGRTRVTAPFDGVVVEGDLTQEIGAAIERGETLFEMAPLDAYRVILEVDETDIDEIEVGQPGTLVVASLPGEEFGYTVERITPISEQEEGRNFFRVEAGLDADGPSLRPGMEGVAKTAIEDRLLVRIWTGNLIDWLRLELWKWMP